MDIPRLHLEASVIASLITKVGFLLPESLILSFPSKNIRTENCQLNFELHLFLKEKVLHKCTRSLRRETSRKFYKTMENIFEGALMIRTRLAILCVSRT